MGIGVTKGLGHGLPRDPEKAALTERTICVRIEMVLTPVAPPGKTIPTEQFHHNATVAITTKRGGYDATMITSCSVPSSTPNPWLCRCPTP